MSREIQNHVCSDGYCLPQYQNGVKVFCPCGDDIFIAPEKPVVSKSIQQRQQSSRSGNRLIVGVASVFAFMFILTGLSMVVVTQTTVQAAAQYNTVIGDTMGYGHFAILFAGFGLFILLGIIAYMVFDTNKSGQRLVLEASGKK
ncbi:MAG: hypothetical protein FWE45_02255 [Firmicutes bacterium]|nr:hypothetical protein [Bacillota bacterium]